MRTATPFLIFAVSLLAAPQDRATRPDAAANQEKPAVAAPATRFEANPASVTAGQATQLTWKVEGATNVNIEPVVGSVPASGSAPVTPSETTIYTLTASLPSGIVKATATVTVNTPGTEDGKSPASATPASNETVSLPAPGSPAANGSTPKTPAVTAPLIDPGKMGAPRSVKPVGVNVDYHEFVLGAEDQIAISVYGSPEFSGTHMIRPDGKITLNFIGEVMAADRTPEELGNDIKERIKKYIVEPDVSVSVLMVKSKKYFIQGEVGRTGEFPLTVPTRVLEALVNAGGFKDFANKKNIIIMRNTTSNSTERLKFNYNEVIKGKHLEQNIYLKPGDIILVR
jgi:polysaccharide export outer membrane protein